MLFQKERWGSHLNLVLTHLYFFFLNEFVVAWLKYLIKLHYDQQHHSHARTKAGLSSSLSSAVGSPSLTSLSVSSPNASAPPSQRLSVAAMAAQLVAEQAAANQPAAMFDNDDIINIVEDCLQSSLIHVSPLIRSVLNTVIECDADIKEKIGPLLRQIDQRIVAGAAPVQVPAAAATATTTTTTVSVGGSVWHEESIKEGDTKTADAATESHCEDTEMVNPESSATLDPEADRQQVGEAQEAITTSAPSQGAWTLFEEDSWRPCPLGCLPGGVLPDLSLPWELDNPPIARVMV